MLRITEQRGTEPNSWSVVLEGRLAGPWVEEFDVYCRQLSQNHQWCAVIDLTGVTFVDAAGKTLLAHLWQQGAELRASGCLTRCIVEEITETRRCGPLSWNHDKRASPG